MEPAKSISAQAQEDALAQDVTEQKKPWKITTLFHSLFGTQKPEKKGKKESLSEKKLVPNADGLEKVDNELEELLKKAKASVKLGKDDSSSSSIEEKYPISPLLSETQSTATSSSRSPSTSPLLFMSKKIEAHHKELLTLLVEKESNPWFWDAMCLCNEAVIVTQELFSLIWENTNDLLDDFCRVWIIRNRKTLLFDKAKPFLEKMIDIEEAPTLPLMAKVPMYTLRLEKVTTDTNTDIVAQDLLYQQGLLYMALSSHDLIASKWKQQPTALGQYLKHQKSLSDFALDTILDTPREDRKDMINFFLKTYCSSLALHDYATAASLGRCLRNKRIQTMLENWYDLDEIPNLGRFMRDISGLGDESQIETMHEKTIACMPNIIPYLKRLKSAVEEAPKVGEGYNIAKLKKIYQTIHSFLEQQQQWNRELPTVLKTDFISEHLKKYTPITEAERDSKM